ncbi:MAG: preprotein translocase subunit SecG [Anaerolineaceae bacterium]|nr:preprotein translocase subunit SecG [Anaerolineaceae bacterium]MBN2678309.1 preprotein translocase subunit SecG [Anaerolineaceae bacterium]
MKNYLDIALIITSVAMIASIIMQSKGTGIGGLSNVDTGGVFMARRGVEKTLFVITIILAVIFFILTLADVYVSSQ